MDRCFDGWWLWLGQSRWARSGENRAGAGELWERSGQSWVTAVLMSGQTRPPWSWGRITKHVKCDTPLIILAGPTSVRVSSPSSYFTSCRGLTVCRPPTSKDQTRRVRQANPAAISATASSIGLLEECVAWQSSGRLGSLILADVSHHGGARSTLLRVPAYHVRNFDKGCWLQLDLSACQHINANCRKSFLVIFPPIRHMARRLRRPRRRRQSTIVGYFSYPFPHSASVSVIVCTAYSAYLGRKMDSASASNGHAHRGSPGLHPGDTGLSTRLRVEAAIDFGLRLSSALGSGPGKVPPTAE